MRLEFDILFQLIFFNAISKFKMQINIKNSNYNNKNALMADFIFALQFAKLINAFSFINYFFLEYSILSISKTFWMYILIIYLDV